MSQDDDAPPANGVHPRQAAMQAALARARAAMEAAEARRDDAPADGANPGSQSQSGQEAEETSAPLDAPTASPSLEPMRPAPTASEPTLPPSSTSEEASGPHARLSRTDAETGLAMPLRVEDLFTDEDLPVTPQQAGQTDATPPPPLTAAPIAPEPITPEPAPATAAAAPSFTPASSPAVEDEGRLAPSRPLIHHAIIGYAIVLLGVAGAGAWIALDPRWSFTGLIAGSDVPIDTVPAGVAAGAASADPSATPVRAAAAVDPAATITEPETLTFETSIDDMPASGAGEPPVDLAEPAPAEDAASAPPIEPTGLNEPDAAFTGQDASAEPSAVAGDVTPGPPVAEDEAQGETDVPVEPVAVDPQDASPVPADTAPQGEPTAVIATERGVDDQTTGASPPPLDAGDGAAAQTPVSSPITPDLELDGDGLTNDAAPDADGVASNVADGMIAEAQTLLTQMGYGPGVISGRIGPFTRIAARDFGAEAAVEDTEITPEFVDVLRREVAAGRRAIVSRNNPGLARVNRIRMSQTMLNGLGYDAGPADGAAGVRTLTAAERFAADTDFTFTGFTAEFVYALQDAGASAIGDAAPDPSPISDNDDAQPPVTPTLAADASDTPQSIVADGAAADGADAEDVETAGSNEAIIADAAAADAVPSDGSAPVDDQAAPETATPEAATAVADVTSPASEVADAPTSADGAQEAASATPDIPAISAMSEAQIITEIQQRLTALGYSPGPADGVWGARTERAAASFAVDQDLEALELSGGFLQVLRDVGADAPTPAASER